MQDDRDAVACRSGALEVGAQRSPADLIECEGAQRGAVGHAGTRVGLTVAVPLAEQLVGHGFDRRGDVEACLADELAAELQQVAGGRQMESVAAEVVVGVVRTVEVGQLCEGLDPGAPVTELGDGRRVDQYRERREHGLAVAVVDGVGQHPCMVDTDAPDAERGVDRAQIGAQPPGERHAPAGGSVGQVGLSCEPRGGGETVGVFGRRRRIERREGMRLGCVEQPSGRLELADEAHQVERLGLVEIELCRGAERVVGRL